MQKLTVRRAGGSPVRNRAHVGAVASGNLEVLLELPRDDAATVVVHTIVDGFDATWRATIMRFLERHDFAADIEINDFGATPAVVSLRLEQALEIAR